VSCLDNRPQSSAVDPEEYLTEGVYLLGSSPAWPDYIFFHAVCLLYEIAGPAIFAPFPKVVRVPLAHLRHVTTYNSLPNRKPTRVPRRSYDTVK
jgi:hypothetical protein